MELTKLHIEWLEAQIVANNAQNAYFQALVEEMKGTGKDISPAPAIKTPEPEKMEEAPKKAGRPATVSPEDKKLRKLVADRVRNARQSFAKLGYTTDIKDYGELVKHYAEAIGTKVPDYETGREDVALKALLKVARAPKKAAPKKTKASIRKIRKIAHEIKNEGYGQGFDLLAMLSHTKPRWKETYDIRIEDMTPAAIIKRFAYEIDTDIPDYEEGREDVALEALLEIGKRKKEEALRNHVPDDDPDDDAPRKLNKENHDSSEAEGKEAPEGDSPCQAAMEVEGGEAGATPVVSASAEAAPVDSKEEPGDLPGLVYWTDPRDTMPKIDRGNMVTSIVSLYSITGLPWRFNPAELGTMSKGELSRELMIIGTEWDIQRDYGIADEDELYLMALYSIINDVEESVAAKMSRDDLLAFFSRREVIDCLRRNAA